MSNSVNTHHTPLLQRIFRAKSSISVVFFVYCVSILSQLVISLSASNTYAASAQPLTRLIAVLVDQSIYDSYQTQVDRYASQYLQSQYSDSKALVIPIRSANFQAQDIHKMLQNLYFEWQKDTPSQLIGVTLIGDIALPVVNDNSYHYPTIYPYVDFIDPQFVYSEQEQTFVPNPQWISQNPELRHNLVRFDTGAEYNAFFLKLAKYSTNPKNRVSDKVWVDDLVAEQKSYDQWSLNNYANQFVFAEDLWRQRYTNLLLDLTNAQEGNKTYDLFSGASKNPISANTSVSTYNDAPAELVKQEADTAASLDGYFKWVGKLASLLKGKKSANSNTFDSDKVGWLSSSQWVPTLFLQQVMDGYLKDYYKLYSEEYHTSVNNLVEPSGRYINSGDKIGINSHIWKTYQEDELAKTIILNLNDQLESKIDTLIESEKLYMTVPVPTKRLTYRSNPSSSCGSHTNDMILEDIRDVSYFGTDPWTSSTIQDMMIFRWSFLNLTWVASLSGYDYTKVPLLDKISTITRSVWSSYGIQSREVEANRWYNVMLAQQDEDYFGEVKKLILVWSNECSSAGLDSVERYKQRYWWWYTPMNIDSDHIAEYGSLSLNLKALDYRHIWSPSYAVNGATFGGTVYDIAWSKMINPLFRKLWVVAWTQEYVTNTYADPNWVSPTDCSWFIDNYYQLESQLASITEEYQRNCVDRSDNYCPDLKKDVDDTAQQIQDIENSPENSEKLSSCFPTKYTVIQEIKPQVKTDVSLKDISDNYTGYSTFAAIQWTAYRPDITFRTRATSAYVESKLRRFKWQDGLNYAIAQAVESKSLKPILYCNSDKRKITYNYSTVDYLRVVNTPAVGWVKKRVMINNGLSSTAPTLEEEKQIDACQLIYDQVYKVEDEIYKKAQEGKSAWLFDFKKKLWLAFDIIKLNKQTAAIKEANMICFLDNKPIFNYEAKAGACGWGWWYMNMYDYYYKTLPSLFVHKSPTAEELYGKELKQLKGIQKNYAYPDIDSMRKEGKRRAQYDLTKYRYDGLKVEVDAISFVLIPGEDYSLQWDFIYFTSGASLNLYGKSISLNNMMGVFSGGSIINLTGSDKLNDIARATFKYPRYGAMNMGTSDRPIDSVRYSSFQGIGGDLVKLVYPNLYNVSVFDANGKLMSEEQIKIEIMKYLIKQAQLYRSQLQAQQDKSQTYYNTQKKWFDILAKADKYATPNRNYDLSKIGDDFFVKWLAMKVGTKQFSYQDVITILARNLYYQNLISPEKKSDVILDKELDGLYKNIALDNINSKRKFTFATYLTYDSNKTTWGVDRLTDWTNLSGLLLPGYDIKWYEITSLTSDGADYHVDPTLNPALKAFQLTSDTMSATPRRESNQETLTPLVCGNKTFDRWWVPILQYPKSFACWLEDVKKSSITITVNGDLVDLIKTINQSGWKVAATWYFADQIGYADSWKQFGSQALDVPGQFGWLIDSAVKVATLGKTQTSLGTDYQKWRWNLTTNSGWKFLDNDPLYDPSAMTNLERSMSEVLGTLAVDASSYQLPINGTGTLTLSTSNRSQPYTMSISGTGSACLTLNGVNTCTQPVQINGRWSKVNDKVEYKVGIAAWAKLWDAWLLVKICLQGSATCFSYPIIYTIIPGQIARIKAIDILDGGYLARGSRMPLVIQWYDADGRPLSIAPQPYRITSDKGNLSYMSQTTKSVDVNTWQNLTMLYDSAWLTVDSDRLTIAPIFADDVLLPVVNYTIPLADPTLRLSTRAGDRTLEQGITIDLPSKPNTLTKWIWSGLTTLVPDQVPMIRLSLADVVGKWVLGEIKISSVNGLVSPGMIGSQIVTGANNIKLTQRVWSDQDSFVITGAGQQIYLYPSYRAGKDIIQVSIGDRVWSIPVVVRPGSAAWVTITAPERLNQYQTGTVDLTVTDYWGNQLTSDTWLSLTAYGRGFTLVWSTNPTTTSGTTINDIQTIKGTAHITVVPKAIIGKGYVTAQVRDVALDQQRSSYAGVLVQSILWPTKKINSLIVELKGNDWGNIWYQTSTDVKASRVITDSSKLLSVVTNLIEPSKLRQSQLIINPHGWITGPQSQWAKLSLVQGTWNIITAGEMLIPLDKSVWYALVQSNTGALTVKPSAAGIYYIPTLQDSIITSNRTNGSAIMINGINVLDLKLGTMHPDITMSYIDTTNYGAGVYGMIYQGKQVGMVIMYRPDTSLLKSIWAMKSGLSDIYDVMTGYVWWSTNSEIGIHIVTRDSSYTLDQNEKSQGDSLIVQFGQWLTVGDASKRYDQFSITYGDAALSRSTINVPAYALVDGSNDPLKPLPITQNLPYDTGIGQLIYHNPDKPIDRVDSIDFNNDGLKDLLIVYTDGSVRLLKSYGGKQPWRDLWHLMIIADGIQDLYVGDVDKNGYQDIIVHTQAGKLRVYYNNRWQFDVDGYPVCLDIPGGPDDLSQLYYWTIRDMDDDKGIDITTYDYNGDIKVFYGGRWGSSEGSSYVSRDHDLCDPDWKSRQQSVLVQSFGMNLLTTPIKDDSLLHWSTHVTRSNPYDQPIVKRESVDYYQNYEQLSGLESKTTPTLSASDAEKAGLTTDTNFASWLPKDKNGWDYNATTFGSDVASRAVNSINVSQAVNAAYTDASRYVPVPDSLRPTYQTKGTTLYLPTNKTSSGDPFAVTKTFKDLNGGLLIDRDLVQVTVKISGTPGVQFAYLDKLTWPWMVPLTEAGQLEWMSDDFLSLKSWITYNTDGYIFAINGATMNSAGVLSLSYIVQYRSEKLAEVVVKDPLPWSRYPMIQAWSIDWCQKVERNYVSQWPTKPRVYASKIIDYKPEIIAKNTLSYTDFDKQTQKQTAELITSVGKEDGVFDYIKERWNNDNVWQRIQGITDGTYLQSIPTQFRIGLQSWSKEQERSNNISKFTNNLCNGFKIGEASCAGTTPPTGVPFNMAFPPLTPGTVNIMWYKVFEDKWLPLLAFPTSWPIPIWPPNPTNAWWWLGDTASVSQFRFYATPTLTASLGFAFCFGPYGVWVKLPAPFKNVVGNCIVLATQPLLKKQQQCSVASNPSYSPPAQPDLPTCYGDLTTDLSKSNVTQMVTMSDETQAWLERQRLTSPSDLYYNNTYYGWDTWETYASSHAWVAKAIQTSNSVIHINKPARVGSSVELFCLGNCGGPSAWQTVKWFVKNSIDPANTQTKVRQVGKWVMKGIGACVMQIADNQIQYVKNNLLTSSLTVVLPDLSRLWASSDQWNTLSNNSSNVGWSMWDGLDRAAGVATWVVDAIADINLKNMLSSVSNQSANSKIIDTMSQSDINPFYPIEQLFNDIELINISHKNVMVDVPYIRTTDLSLYKTQFVWWAQRNEQIIKQWVDYGDGLATECLQLSDPVKKQECNELLKQVVYVNTQLGQMKRSINSNKVMFDQYAHFQSTVLPNWKEQQVIYLTEMTNVINSTMSQLAGWSTQNAARFTSWTSSIRSMITAVKTWQLLVDFALNWKERCGTCRIDNYDFATCSLNGLCPNFPLFAWPNFRTPDFTIDLSNIDAGIDIVVPNFKFRPVDVPLYRVAQMSDLPLPPDLWSPIYAQLNIILPTLPVIPGPPTLPSLPSLSMNVDMDLPLLPPAPKIPMLPETLNAAVQVADFVGKILCIVKWDVWLVGEKFVKQKIEQITARTWEVSPFDSIIPVISQPRPQWYNARLDAYVNLRFYFDWLYNVFDEVVDTQWNQSMWQLQQQFAKQINKSSDWVNGWITTGANGITNTANKALSGTILEWGWLPPLRYDATIKPLWSAEFDTRVVAALNQFANSVEDSTLRDASRDIAWRVQKPLQTQANLEGIDRVRRDAQWIVTTQLDKAQWEYQQIKYNYDEWLDTLTSDQYVSDDSQTTTLSTSVYTINPEVADYIQSSDIRHDYLQGNKQLLERYQTALDKGSDSLNLDTANYQSSRAYVDQMLAMTDTALDRHTQLAQYINSPDGKWFINDPNWVWDRSTLPDPGPWYIAPDTASSTTSTSTTTQKTNVKVWFDQSTQRDGYLIDTVVDTPIGKVKAAVDAIKPEWLGTQYRERSFKEDMNGNNATKPDIVLRDDTTIYIKYADQANVHGSHITTKTLYRLPALISPDQLDKLTTSTNGYVVYDPGILSRSQLFRLWSDSYAIANFHLQGQDYNNTLFQWINPDIIGQARNEIYMLKFTNLVDRHPDWMWPDSATQYVPLMIAGVTVNPETTKILIPGTKTARSIKDLIASKTIHDVVSYDPSQDDIVWLLRNLPRSWEYAQVVRMQLKDGAYVATSPWSNQDVWWHQIAADTIAPIPEVKLVRVATKQTVWWWTSMQWYINTNYELTVTWKDNISIARTSVAGITQPRAAVTTIKKIYEQKPTTLSYTFSAQDSSKNVTTINVVVMIDKPELETTSANNTDGARGTVTATLTPDLDDGVIKFQQQDTASWKSLIGMPGGVSWYPVKPLQTMFTGGLYSFPNSRWLKNADWTDAGSVSNQGQITSQDLRLLVRFPQWYPVISMVNASWVVQYELTYAPQTLTGSAPVDIKSPSQYRVLSLENFNAGIAWVFAQGQCIAPQLGECEVYVSKWWDIWVDPAVRSNYYGTYLWRDGHGVYQIMRDKTFVAEVNLVTKEIK